MGTDSDAEKSNSKMTGRFKIEWNWDFDDLWHETESIKLGDREYKIGEEGRFRLKGRCKRCWGGLIGRDGIEREPTAIRCRVCGLVLEGDEAREEYRRMSEQSGSNTLNMLFDFPPKYRDDATFVQKFFPHIDRQSEDEFRERIEEAASRGDKEGWLTRTRFPAGSAGFLLLQARALMSGVERLPRELSAAPFWDSDLHDDGSATVYLPTKELSEDPKADQHELMKRLGSTMTIAMMSAFACELAMKAVRLTRMDEARKSHDLWQLYSDVPADSKERIERDFPEICTVLKSARHTFDKWRYFEANVGGRGMSAMIDTERALDLAKAARVLLDEAEIVGLGYSVKLTAKKKVTKIENRQKIHIKHNLTTKGTELPPR